MKLTIQDDDYRDLRIHHTIDLAISVVMSLRSLSRERARQCLNLPPNAHEPSLDVICEMHSLDRAELAERVSAFIENEEMEESCANTIPADAPSWSNAPPA